jgi:hypothetical protein
MGCAREVVGPTNRRGNVGTAPPVQGRFPEFQLEDELFRQAGGNDVDRFFARQYVRKNKKATTSARPTLNA